MKNAEEQNAKTAAPQQGTADDEAGTLIDIEPADRPQPDSTEINELIRKRVYAAVAMGFVPLPLVDLAGLTAIQIEMLCALCKAHGIAFQKQWIKSAISSLCGSGVTVAAVPVLSSLLKTIPVIGLTTSAATISMSGAATTYALGRVFDRHFRNGGTLRDFDTEKSKAYFSEKLEEGKAFVKKMKPGKKQDAAPSEATQSASETA